MAHINKVLYVLIAIQRVKLVNSHHLIALAALLIKNCIIVYA